MFWTTNRKVIEEYTQLDLFCQRIFKLVASCQNSIILGNSERPDEFDQKEDNLYATDDGESSEEPHGASDEAELCVKLDLLVAFYLVKGRRVKVDLNQVKRGFWSMLT